MRRKRVSMMIDETQQVDTEVDSPLDDATDADAEVDSLLDDELDVDTEVNVPADNATDVGAEPDTLQDDVIRGEQGKIKIWYEVWHEIQRIEPEIEQLSIDIEEQEIRRDEFAKRRNWANTQKLEAEADAYYTRRHKKFKLMLDKERVEAMNKRAAVMGEKAAATAKEERALAAEISHKHGHLARMAERRSRLYELLRSMNLG